jgi:hypothetical protein
MQSMIALRAFAIASNVLFIAYSIEARLPPILILHAILLPINCWSLARLRLGKRAAVAFSVLSIGLLACVLGFHVDDKDLALLSSSHSSRLGRNP